MVILFALEVIRGTFTNLTTGVGDTTRARTWKEYFLDEQQTGGMVMSQVLTFWNMMLLDL